MTRFPTVLLLGFAVLSPPGQAATLARPEAPALILAQAGDAAGSQPTTPEGGAIPASPANAPGSPSAPQGGTAAPNGAPAATNTTSAQPNPRTGPTGPTRNGAAALPTLAQPGTGPSGSLDSSITYGGPQVDTQPVYGSPLRSNGAGNGGTPTYSSAPGTLGGPINGTANSYFATLPNGATAPGQPITNGRGTRIQDATTSSTRQPLGGAPYTRDQTGTFGGRGGYTAQGVYNGTAAQTGDGYGYGSTFATTGRPTGGLLGTGVDATGPLRPYIPQNTGIIGRPNSGYGVPNGSRSTHMDGRGIQRLD